ncbi:hypothetical protein GGS20DRAFT_565254 [Poronia punctata]|nr:hypothetical protein GGS20DRAFT_565254 [Poronia punctata]
MPADDYSSGVAGGALKLKGGKIQKSSKKKKKAKDHKDKDVSSAKQLERARSESDSAPPPAADEVVGSDEPEYKTEAERQHEEAMKKKMQRMLEDPALASEIKKTHKERVESLNTYLSKLSEHHDMPKIGPG